MLSFKFFLDLKIFKQVYFFVFLASDYGNDTWDKGKFQPQNTHEPGNKLKAEMSAISINNRQVQMYQEKTFYSGKEIFQRVLL